MEALSRLIHGLRKGLRTAASEQHAMNLPLEFSVLAL